MSCSSCRAAQELGDKHPEPLRVAAPGPPQWRAVWERVPPGGGYGGGPALEGLMDHQLVEDPMDIPTHQGALPGAPGGTPSVECSPRGPYGTLPPSSYGAGPYGQGPPPPGK